MSLLFNEPAIVQSIGGWLSIIDRVSCSSVNTCSHTALHKTDLDYYRERLQRIHISYDPTHAEDILIEYPADQFLEKTNKTSNPKETCLSFCKQLATYVRQLYQSDESFPNDAEDVEQFFGIVSIDKEQASILKGLKKYLEIDDADIEIHCTLQAKLTKLTRDFTKLKFDELQKSFDDENYVKVSLLVETLNVLAQEDLVVEFFQQENQLPLGFFPSSILDVQGSLQEESLDNVISDLSEFFNTKSQIIDQCFADHLPVMLLYTEKLLHIDFINDFLTQQCNKSIGIVPEVYYKLIDEFVPMLRPSKNAGESFPNLVINFINLYFEPLVVRFSNEEINNFENEAINEFRQFENELVEQEKIDKDNIYKSLLGEKNNEEAKSNKFELLTSFTNIFNTRSNKDKNELNFKVKLELVNKNLDDLKNFINFELCSEIIEKARRTIQTFRIFNKVENSIFDSTKINSQIEVIFIKLVTIITNYHVKYGFEKSIELLNKYDPTEFKSLESLDSLNTVEPLVKFTELINVGDLIQQMVEIFYNNELVLKKIVNKNEFLNSANQTKKKFESVLDNFVADGLNIGIDKLMCEVEFLYNTLQLPNEFNTDPNDTTNTGPTKCAVKVVEMLSNHINLLNGTTEKGVIDVFQQEIGERFFQIIAQNIKKRSISTSGAIILISDLNIYYDFVVYTLKQKNIIPLFVALKEVGQLYLIDSADSKELGKLIGDLSRFNGIFKQEEIYEFVQKRTDWPKVKRDVEKAMYGLGIGDCTIT